MAALLCNAGVASALGFGAIRVHSALNEPLDATINLVALTPEEKTALQVDMASVDMFQRFGIERTALADRIRIVANPGNESSQVLLRLTTDAPVREPFLRFLIEADTGNGRALREYTVLLDPPGQAPQPPSGMASASAPPASSQSSRASAADTAPVAPEPAAPEPTAAPARAEPRSDRYGPVAAGETLSRIAARLRRPDTTLDQMQVAIYRNNPQAFSDNMNILLRGAMLAIPPVERIRSIAPGEARAVVRAQQAEAVERLASTATDSSAQPTVAQGESAPATTDARLRLEPSRIDGQSAGGAVGTAGFGRLTLPDFGPGEGSVGAGDAASPDTDTADTDTGTDPMVSDGRAVADRGEQAPGGDNAPTDTAVDSATRTNETAAQSPTDETDALSSTARDATTEVDATTGDNAAAGIDNEPAGAAADQDIAASSADRPATTDAMVTTGDTDEALQPDSASDAVADSTDTAVAADSGSMQSQDSYRPLPAQDVDVVGASDGASLLSPRNLLLLAGGLGLAALLLAWRRRRQYKPVPLHFEAEGDHPVAPSAEEEFEQPGEARQAYIAPAPNTTRPSLRIEQADAQIKAGEFDQARATLEAGLGDHPHDSALQDKRLELDYLTGDDNAFMGNIERFGSALTGNGVRWAGVAAMGRVLRPDDPRFALGLTDDGPTPAAAEAEPDDEPQDPESAEALYESFISSRDSGLDEELPPAIDDESSDDGHYFTIDESLPDSDDADAAHTELDLPEAPKRASETPDEQGFEWQDQEIADGGERQHDQGDDPGLAFDLDSVDDDAGKDKPRSVETIDDSEFDLDAEDDTAAEDDVETDPVEIRLDLARMYIEMEDATAARELLEEVQSEGNEAQRATATELLNTL
ncbi:FimV/HubP family polar landmark protein [Salinisphaera sp. S4-8]|uniref:FimV/HubP family polar landmark protein n=1 Tax=Salinisphaera sp. S4-8 TaxID=633357 RepID=UPI00333E433A